MGSSSDCRPSPDSCARPRSSDPRPRLNRHNDPHAAKRSLQIVERVGSIDLRQSPKPSAATQPNNPVQAFLGHRLRSDVGQARDDDAVTLSGAPAAKSRLDHSSTAWPLSSRPNRLRGTLFRHRCREAVGEQENRSPACTRSRITSSSRVSSPPRHG